MRRFHISLPFVEIDIAGEIAVGRVFGLRFERVGPCVALTTMGRTKGFILPGTTRA